MSAKNVLNVDPENIKIIQDWLKIQPHLPDTLGKN